MHDVILYGMFELTTERDRTFIFIILTVGKKDLQICLC